MGRLGTDPNSSLVRKKSERWEKEEAKGDEMGLFRHAALSVRKSSESGAQQGYVVELATNPGKRSLLAQRFFAVNTDDGVDGRVAALRFALATDTLLDFRLFLSGKQEKYQHHGSGFGEADASTSSSVDGSRTLSGTLSKVESLLDSRTKTSVYLCVRQNVSTGLWFTVALCMFDNGDWRSISFKDASKKCSRHGRFNVEPTVTKAIAFFRSAAFRSWVRRFTNRKLLCGGEEGVCRQDGEDMVACKRCGGSEHPECFRNATASEKLQAREDHVCSTCLMVEEEEITVIRLEEQGELGAAKLEGWCNDTRITHSDVDDRVCFFCGCESNEDLDYLVPCPCENSSAVHHPGCAAICMDLRASSKQPSFLCHICAEEGGVPNGGIAVSSSKIENKSTDKEQIAVAFPSKKLLKPVQPSRGVKRHYNTTENGGVDKIGELSEGLPVSDIEKEEKNKQGAHCGQTDMVADPEKQLGITILGRRFNDAAATVPIKKRRIHMVEMRSPSPPPSSPSPDTQECTKLQEAGMDVLATTDFEETSSKEGAVMTCELSKDVLGDGDILKFNGLNVDNCNDQQNVLNLGLRSEDTVSGDWHVSDSFKKAATGINHLKEMSELPLHIESDRCLKIIDLDAEPGGNTHSLHKKEEEKCSPLTIGLVVDPLVKDGLSKPLEASLKERACDVIVEDVPSKGSRMEFFKCGEVSEAQIEAVDIETAWTGDKMIPTSPGSQGKLEMMSQNQVGNNEMGHATQLALTISGSLDSSIVEPVDAWTAPAGKFVPQKAGCSKNDVDEKGGTVLRLNTGYARDVRLHWDLNREMEAWGPPTGRSSQKKAELRHSSKAFPNADIGIRLEQNPNRNTRGSERTCKDSYAPHDVVYGVLTSSVHPSTLPIEQESQVHHIENASNVTSQLGDNCAIDTCLSLQSREIEGQPEDICDVDTGLSLLSTKPQEESENSCGLGTGSKLQSPKAHEDLEDDCDLVRGFSLQSTSGQEDLEDKIDLDTGSKLQPPKAKGDLEDDRGLATGLSVQSTSTPEVLSDKCALDTCLSLQQAIRSQGGLEENYGLDMGLSLQNTVAAENLEDKCMLDTGLSLCSPKPQEKLERGLSLHSEKAHADLVSSSFTNTQDDLQRNCGLDACSSPQSIKSQKDLEDCCGLKRGLNLQSIEVHGDLVRSVEKSQGNELDEDDANGSDASTQKADELCITTEKPFCVDVKITEVSSPKDGDGGGSAILIIGAPTTVGSISTMDLPVYVTSQDFNIAVTDGGQVSTDCVQTSDEKCVGSSPNVVCDVSESGDSSFQEHMSANSIADVENSIEVNSKADISMDPGSYSGGGDSVEAVYGAQPSDYDDAFDEDEIASGSESPATECADEGQDVNKYDATLDVCVEDSGEEFEAEEHVDYGDSDCRDADEVGLECDERLSLALQAESDWKAGGLIDSAELEVADGQVTWEEGTMAEDFEPNERGAEIGVSNAVGEQCVTTSDDQKKDGHTGKEVLSQVNAIKLQGPQEGSEDLRENQEACGKENDVSSGVNLMTVSKPSDKEISCKSEIQYEGDSQKGKPAELRNGKNSSPSRTKTTGWDQLPEGFESAEEALRAAKEMSARRGRGFTWSGHNTRVSLRSSQGLSGGGRFGAGLIRGSLPWPGGQFDERGRSDDLIHARESYSHSRRLDDCFEVDTRFSSSREIGRGRNLGRGSTTGVLGRGRVDPWMDVSGGQRGSGRHDSPRHHVGSSGLGSRGQTNAAAVAAAKVESSGFVVAPDGTIIKAGSSAGRGGMRMTGVSRGRGRGPSVDVDAGMAFSMRMGMGPGRGFGSNPDAGRDRIMGAGGGVLDRGGPGARAMMDRYHQGPPFGGGIDRKGDSPHNKPIHSLDHALNLPRIDRSLSPRRSRGRVSRSHTRSGSRSRSVSPWQQSSPRAYHSGGLGKILSFPGKRSRSPSGLKSEARVVRSRSSTPSHQSAGPSLKVLQQLSEKREEDRSHDRDYKRSVSRTRTPSRRTSPHVIHGSALMDERDRQVLAGVRHTSPTRGKHSEHPRRSVDSGSDTSHIKTDDNGAKISGFFHSKEGGHRRSSSPRTVRIRGRDHRSAVSIRRDKHREEQRRQGLSSLQSRDGRHISNFKHVSLRDVDDDVAPRRRRPT